MPGVDQAQHGDPPGTGAWTGTAAQAVLERSDDRPAPDPARWRVLAVLCLALLIIGLDGTIVNVALPKLVVDLGATSSQLQWIVDSYTIVFAAFLLVAGNTGDRLGRKRCFVGGLVVFGLGSLACSQVDSAGPLIVMRGVQGLGAAFVMPSTLSILANVFTEEKERARAIALWAGVSGIGVALGPLAGGFLLEHFAWGSIFLINVPVVVVAVIAAVAIVPESRDEDAPRLDLVGTVLSGAGLVALLYGIIEGPAKGWDDPVIVTSLIAGVVLLVAFVFWERSSSHPLLDVRLFTNARFSAASGAVTLVFFALFGTLFFVSQYLQFVMGFDAMECGVRLLPLAGSLMVAAPLSARLVVQLGTKVVVAAGLAFVVAGLLLFSTTTVDSAYPHVAVVLVVIGIGMGLAMAPATESIMGSLPPTKAGIGSAMNDTTRQIGGALGVAILGSITNGIYRSQIESAPGFTEFQQIAPEAADAVRESVGGAAVVATQLPPDLAQLLTDQANQAFIDGLGRATVVGAVVACFGVLVALLWLPSRSTTVTEEGYDGLVDGAARHLESPEAHIDLARSTLEVMADAGLSSLSYNGIAAQAGISTVTLDRVWTSRVDAVTDSLRVMVEAHPVPDTGDLKADLRSYLRGIGDNVSGPQARRVVGALIGEAGADPELARSLRHHVLDPRRAELAARMSQGLGTTVDLASDTAVDELIGPIFHRALIGGATIDDDFVASVVDGVLASHQRA